MADTSLGYIEELPVKIRQTEVRSQVIVMVKGAIEPYYITTENEITQNDRIVEYPGGVLTILSDPDAWLDLWQDGVNDAGERTKIAVRLFGRHVILLTQAFVFPDGKDMVQS